ncbi:MAG: hypothetical protein KH020_18000 [Clostridiales bacterium]|nr:hypothetical protein [Clostridiales bacterium]
MRLSSLLGNRMEDILIILDEPTVGLHPRDVKNLIGIMKQLTEQGNTILAVDMMNRRYEVQIILSI